MSYQNDQTIPVCSGWLGSWQISLRRRPLSVPELTKRYDQHAPRWQSLTERMGLARAYKRLFEQFVPQTDLPVLSKPIQVLDCGVGTGALSLAFARNWAAPVRMHAVDLSEAMLSKAKQCLEQAGLYAKLERADIRKLPYADNQFDLVMAAHVLEHLPDPEAAFKEIKRVLKPGGWLVLCVTRKSIFGRYIQVKWRTHSMTTQQLDSLLDAAGLQAHSTGLASGGFFRLTSIACIGRKGQLAL